MRFPEPLTIPIDVRRDTAVALHVQLVGQIAAAIDTGVLSAGTRMPSTRTLALSLDVSRGVVHAAYDGLADLGYVRGRSGSGTYVATSGVATTGGVRSGRGTVTGPAGAGGAVPDRRTADFRTGDRGGTGDFRAGDFRAGDRRTADVRTGDGRAGDFRAGDRGVGHDAGGVGDGAAGAWPAGGPRRPAPDGVDLTPGQPCLEAFPLAAWRTAWRHATAHVPTRPPPASGLPELRQAIAAYLLRTRGIVPAGHDIVVTAGPAHGLRLVLDALGWHGPVVAMEDPGPPELHVAAAGPSPLPVDSEGARFDAIAPGARVAVVTPDAHVPFGYVLSGQRRQAALAWAADVDGALVEVGWDPVVRSTSGRIARLVTRTTRVPVAMVASLGGVLTPALGLGFVVVPRELSAGVTHRLREAGGQPGHAAQLAVAHLLANGTAARRMRRLGRWCSRGSRTGRARPRTPRPTRRGDG